MILCLISFQLSIGTTLFIYVAEVLMDQAIGLCLQVLIGVLIVQTFVIEPLFNTEGFGVPGTFLSLGIIQIVIIAYIYFFVKETKGLNTGQKKSLYKSN